MKSLMRYLKNYRRECVLAPLFKMLEASFELLVPLVMAAVIDRGIGMGDRPFILRMALVLAALAAVGLVSSITAQKRMTQAQRDAVKPSMLARFLSGEAGQRLLRAGEVHREWSFNVTLRADEALSAQEAGRFGGEELLVQGTVDCCFIENGQWVLMDYKTDRGDAQTLRERYRPQLSVYALALERITGIPVREKLLCLLGQAQTVEV